MMPRGSSTRLNRPRGAQNPLKDKVIHIAIKHGDAMLFATGTQSEVFKNLSYQRVFEWAQQVQQNNPSIWQSSASSTPVIPETVRSIIADDHSHDFWDPFTTGTCVEKSFAKQKDINITVADLMTLQALIFILKGEPEERCKAKNKRECEQNAESKKKHSKSATQDTTREHLANSMGNHGVGS